MQQKSIPGSYEYLAHPADLKIRAQGETLEHALANLICAMTASFATVTDIKAAKKVAVTFESRRLTSVVFDICQRYLELFDTNQLLTKNIEDIKIEQARGNYKVSCTFVGDLPASYQVNNPIKAPTYHEMAIETKNDFVYVTVVLDI